MFYFNYENLFSGFYWMNSSLNCFIYYMWTSYQNLSAAELYRGAIQWLSTKLEIVSGQSAHQVRAHPGTYPGSQLRSIKTTVAGGTKVTGGTWNCPRFLKSNWYYSHTLQPRTFQFWHNIPNVNIYKQFSQFFEKLFLCRVIPLFNHREKIFF